MLNNFDACDAFTAPAEGGLSMDPTDPGNWTGGKVNVGELKGTKYGIAASAHPNIDIKNLTPEAAGLIRKTGYWIPNNCDALEMGVDLMIYDEDVNAGDFRSAVLLETVLGTESDGKIGPNDIKAAKAYGTVQLIHALATAQENFYRSLPLFAIDGKGWTSRLNLRQSTALSMAASAANAPDPTSEPLIPPTVAEPVTPQPAPSGGIIKTVRNWLGF